MMHWNVLLQRHAVILRIVSSVRLEPRPLHHSDKITINKFCYGNNMENVLTSLQGWLIKV
jgi:hypothetical protein